MNAKRIRQAAATFVANWIEEPNADKAVQAFAETVTALARDEAADMTQIRKGRCEICRAWNPQTSTMGAGQCRRHAAPGYPNKWPMTNPDHWCMEFVPIPLDEIPDFSEVEEPDAQIDLPPPPPPDEDPI